VTPVRPRSSAQRPFASYDRLRLTTSASAVWLPDPQDPSIGYRTPVRPDPCRYSGPMIVFSRSLFATSLVVLVGVLLLGQRLPDWCTPASIAFAVASALVFLILSITAHRRASRAAH